MRLARGAAVVLLAVSLVGGPSVGSVSAASSGGAPTSPSEVTLFGYGSQPMTSSTGQDLHLAIEAEWWRGGGDQETDVYTTLSKGNESHSESHSWSAIVPKSEFSFDTASGTGSVQTGSTLGGLGGVTLSIAPRGSARTRSCGGTSSDVIQPVTVSGSVDLHSHSGSGPHAWGAVSASGVSDMFQHNATVEAVYGNVNRCLGGFPCERTIYWTGPGGIGGLLSGAESPLRSSQRSWLEWSHATTAAGAAPDVSLNREDDAYAPIPALGVKRRTDGGIRIAVGPRRAVGVTGSAVLVASGPPVRKRIACGSGTESLVQWTRVSYENGAQPLTIANDIFGDGSNHDSTKGGSISYVGLQPPPVP
jgi:hypothetical protein